VKLLPVKFDDGAQSVLRELKIARPAGEAAKMNAKIISECVAKSSKDDVLRLSCTSKNIIFRLCSTLREFSRIRHAWAATGEL